MIRPRLQDVRFKPDEEILKGPMKPFSDSQISVRSSSSPSPLASSFFLHVTGLRVQHQTILTRTGKMWESFETPSDWTLEVCLVPQI